MEIIGKILAFIHSDQFLIILSVALGISEALDFIPFIKASSISKAIHNGLVWLKDKLFPPKMPE